MRALYRASAVLAGVVAFGLVGSFVPAALSQAPPAQTVPVIVDGGSPSGHNWEFVDFFPRTLSIHSGDTIDFKWASAPDGFHSATLLKQGITPSQAWSTEYPIAVPDSDDGEGKLMINPAVLGPTNPPPGSGAPGACGDSGTPCTYDGTATENSGANDTDGQSEFFSKLTIAAPATVNLVCLIHAGMGAVISVVSGTADSLSQIASNATAQAIADATQAVAYEGIGSKVFVKTLETGHKLYALTAGIGTGRVEILQMLPKNIRIHRGDKIQFITRAAKEIHTVTFPLGTERGEPFLPMCEGTPDTRSDQFPPDACGGDTSKFEIHFQPQPFGTTLLIKPYTFGSSGIIDGNGDSPFGSNYTFTFPNAGTFQYMCHVHDHMTGVVTVLS